MNDRRSRKYISMFGLSLHLVTTTDGWAYEWKDPNTGRTIAHALDAS